MLNFKTSKSHLITQGLLLFSLLIFTFGTENFTAVLRLPILLIVDVIMLAFFVGSFVRSAVIENGVLTVRTMFRKSSVEIANLEYAQSLSAFARWAMILNDGKHTVILTSLLSGLDDIADELRKTMPEAEKSKLDAITPQSVKSKKRVYNSVMIMLTAIVWFGISKSLVGF